MTCSGAVARAQDDVGRCVLMCNGVAAPDLYIRFSDADARLPVVTRSGAIQMVPWGVHHGDLGNPMPKGPCARLDSIKAGRWRRYDPRPVRIPVTRFSERSPADRCTYWFELPAGLALQGLFVPPAPFSPDGRVYVVTVPLETALQYGVRAQSGLPDGGMEAVHDRWPRLVRLQPD